VVPRAQRPVLNAGVLGQPVAHSLSPVLHEAGYRARGLTQWRYAAHEVSAGGLVRFVAGLDGTWRGLSLTMPLKEAAFDVADSVGETARLTRSINTLVRNKDLGWDAHNTDIAGIAKALEGADHAGTATIIGSGATARSAAAALASLGVQEVVVAARNTSAAAEVVEVLTASGSSGRAVGLEHWADVPTRLVVSTVPRDASYPVGELLHETGSRFTGATLLDVIYQDWPTPLARDANRFGMTIRSGLDMLVHQAAEQFDLFTGKRAPLAEMFAAGREALGL
jgi:shikimate dehydrogenase